jgi:hypothetical protein
MKMKATKTLRSAPWFPLFLLIGLLSTPTLLRAQAVTCSGLSDDAFPCSYQIEELGLQRVPAVFKLQARVAQAKLPVGEGEFSAVVVQVLRGQKVLCMESFANVKVRQSVLNLRIGEHMNCELDEIIAENQDLAFKICLGSDTNCLEAIDFSATPYAIKATYAHTAETSDKANTAAQAHYAHRMTADRDLFLRHALGTGYLDFHTPTSARVQSFYDEVGYSCPAADDTQECAAGGFLQWTPIRDADALHLHIAGKADVGDEMKPLETLVFASEETYATGNSTTQGKATVEDGLYVTNQGAHVTGASDIAGTLVVSEMITIEAGGLQVQGGGAHVTGASDVTGTLTVSDATTVQAGGLTVAAGGAQVSGDSSVSGVLTANGALAVNGDAQVNGALKISGDAHQMRLDATGQVLDIHGLVRFHNAAEFVGGTTEPNSPYVKKENETDPVTLNGGLTVSGPINLGEVSGGLTVTGGLSASGPLGLGIMARKCENPGAGATNNETGFGCLCEVGEYPISASVLCPLVDPPGNDTPQTHYRTSVLTTSIVSAHEPSSAPAGSPHDEGVARFGMGSRCYLPWSWGSYSPAAITVLCIPNLLTTPATGTNTEYGVEAYQVPQ